MNITNQPIPIRLSDGVEYALPRINANHLCLLTMQYNRWHGIKPLTTPVKTEPLLDVLQTPIGARWMLWHLLKEAGHQMTEEQAAELGGSYASLVTAMVTLLDFEQQGEESDADPTILTGTKPI